MVRIKERYILVNVISPPSSSKPTSPDVPDYVSLHRPITENLNPRLLLKAIRAEVSLLFGHYGLGAADSGLSVKYLSCATATFILKASRKYYRLVWAALTMMNHIPGSSTSCVFRVVHISGTIRKAEEEAIRRARRFILAAKDVAANKTRNETFYATFDSGENIMDIDGSSDCGDE